MDIWTRARRQAFGVWRLAFDASDVEWVNEAVADGSLALRFTSRYFSPFDVDVSRAD